MAKKKAPQNYHPTKSVSKTKVVRDDGWANLITGMGVANRDKRTAALASWERISETEVEHLYAGDDVAKKIVDAVPEDGTRKWVRHTNLNEKQKKEMAAEERRIRAPYKVCEAWRLARMYGGGALIPILKGDGPDSLARPLNLEAGVGQILQLLAVSRWELMPEGSELTNDITSANFGLPEFYRLNLSRTNAGAGKNDLRVHWSRVIRFDGSYLPPRLFRQNDYWSDSVLNACKDKIRNYSAAHDAASASLEDFSVPVMKMKGLADAVSAGRESEVRTRVDLANMAKSVIRMILLDEEESMEHATRTMTGMPEVLEKVEDRLVVGSEMPRMRLLGESPTGMQANGNSEEKMWFDYVERQQTDVLEPKLNQLFDLIYAQVQGPFKGKKPKDSSFEFIPLFQMSESDTVTMRKAQADMDKIYIDAGVLDASEVRQSRFGGEAYSIVTEIDPDLDPVPPTDPAAAEGLGGEDPDPEDDPEADPDEDTPDDEEAAKKMAAERKDAKDVKPSDKLRNQRKASAGNKRPASKKK